MINLTILSLLLSTRAILCCGYKDIIQGENRIPNPIRLEAEDTGSITDGRILQISSGFTNASVHNMRAILDYSDIDNRLYNGRNGEALAGYLFVKKNLAKVVAFIGSQFTVYYRQKFSFPKFYWAEQDIDIPGRENVEGDFYAFVVSERKAGLTYLMAATSYGTAGQMQRPLLGIIFVNLPVFHYTAKSDYSYFQTFLHEVFHMMGFGLQSFRLFPVYDQIIDKWYFTDVTAQATRVDGSKYTELRITAVTSWAKSYFNCPTLSGLPLEDNGDTGGTQGSHWDKLFLQNEIMTPSAEPKLQISPLTLQVLAATGWYGITPGSEQVWLWGKGQGCGMFNICPQPANLPSLEVCSVKGQQSCFADYKTKATCSSNKYFNKPECLMNTLTSNYCNVEFKSQKQTGADWEWVGNQGRCVVSLDKSGARTSRCLKASCASITGPITYSNDRGLSIECTTTGQIVKIDDSTSIECPSMVDFCSKIDLTCIQGCEDDGNGVCLASGQCLCFFGTIPGRRCREWSSLSSLTQTFGYALPFLLLAILK